MITLAEVLLKSGWTQEQIDALDAKARTGLTDYVTGIEQTAAQKEKAAQDLAVKAEADRKAQEAAVVAAKAAQEAAELQNRSVKDFWDNTYNPGIAAAEAEKTRLAKEAADAKRKQHSTRRRGKAIWALSTSSLKMLRYLLLPPQPFPL
jgi:hypothetical protein